MTFAQAFYLFILPLLIRRLALALPTGTDAKTVNIFIPASNLTPLNPIALPVQPVSAVLRQGKKAPEVRGFRPCSCQACAFFMGVASASSNMRAL